VLATAGDLAMLWVVNARRAELALVEGPGGLLTIGGWLGVLSIPLFALGYMAASTLVDPSRPCIVRVVNAGGVVAGVTGGVIHGLTARVIAASIATRGAALDPVSELSSAPALIGLWVVAICAALAASVAFATGVRAERGIALASMNPVLLTLALSVLALPTELSRSFLAPAAPNLAHVMFFGICARVLARDACERA
jgi:hypothetical protein